MHAELNLTLNWRKHSLTFLALPLYSAFRHESYAAIILESVVLNAFAGEADNSINANKHSPIEKVEMLRF